MKRRLSVIALLACAALPAFAQRDLLKPFRPDGAKPEKPAEKPEEKPTPKPKPAAEKPDKVAEKPEKPEKASGEVPLKPFRPGDEPAKAVPIKPKPAEEDPAAPKAKPVKRPAEMPPEETPVPTEPSANAEAPKAKPVPPRPVAPEVAEPGDLVVKPGTAPTAPDQVQLQFADSAYAKKAWRDAAPEYERYLERYPRAAAADRQAALYRLAECYRQTDALNAAKRNYEAVLNGYTGGEFLGYAAYRLGSILYEEKDYRGALQIYRRASVRLTQPTLILASKFFIGRCLEATGQKTEARVQYEDLTQVIENNPYRDASRLSAGRLLEEGKKYEEALKWLLPLSGDSGNPEIKHEALFRTGRVQLELGQHAAAIETLKAALAIPELAAAKAEIQFAIFRALSEMKDYKGLIARYESGAAKDLTQELKLNILVLVANAHRDLGERDAALAGYDQIGRDFPATPQARDAAYARLILLYEAGDDRLLEEVNTFLINNPTAPQVERVSLMKAEALFKKGDFENAAPIYEQIVGKARGLSGDYLGEATFKLGWCRMQLRQWDRAGVIFTDFLKKFPTHAKVPRAHAELGSALMEQKKYSAAQKVLEDLTTKYPKAPERESGLENLALIYGQLGNTSLMASTFEILLRDFPETKVKPKACFWIGNVAFQRKDYENAVPRLEEARTLDPEQYFERTHLMILACYYGLESLAATEKEISSYTANTKRGEKDRAQTPADVIRWLGQTHFEKNEYDLAIKHLSELVIRKEGSPEDFLLLARARVHLKAFKDAVDTYDAYLSLVKEPLLRMRAMIEKVDAQAGLKDWDGAEKTIKDALASAPEGKINGELRLRAAEIEVGRGNVKKALQIYESIPLTMDDDDISPRAIEHAIALHRQHGDEPEAKKLENQLRTKYPEYLQKKKK
jgi:TolA-binding protein